MSEPGAAAPLFRWFSRADPLDESTSASTVARFSTAERGRLESLTPDRAHRFVRGRAALFDAVAQWEKGPWEKGPWEKGQWEKAPWDKAQPHSEMDAARLSIHARCAHCGGPHGAPIIHGAPLVASLSHGHDMSVVALADSRAVAAIGIDTEPDTEPNDAPTERRDAIVSLTGVEPAEALRHWTRIEAVLKADGRGLRVDPSAVRMSGPRHARATASATITGSAHVYDVYDVTGPAGHVTSVAARPR